MPNLEALKETILESASGLTLAEILAQHPQLVRRTAQRRLSQLVDAGLIEARGDGRARRYIAAGSGMADVPESDDGFPTGIALSADSTDILAYIDQPLHSRTPVGYQREFLDAYVFRARCSI